MKFKGRLTYQNFLNYFGNKLEKEERHAFEKKMMQDSFDSEAFDGLSKLSAAEFEKDMTDLNSLLHARAKEKKRRIPVWFPYAASVIILLGLSSVLYYLNQFSTQDEMIGAQTEELAPKIESPILEPEMEKAASKSMDLMEMVENDLEMEISDADEILEEKLMIVSEEEEVESETVPVIKDKTVDIIEPINQLAVAKEISIKETEVTAESMQSVMEGQVAGVEVQKASRLKSAKKSVSNNLRSSQQVISGTVVDEDDMPIPGVSIVVKGTASGVVTDLDGQFKLNASDTSQDYKLVASFIGFESKEINVPVDSNLLVVLEQSNVSLDEVVVVGYETKMKKSTTGSVVIINNDEAGSNWEKAKPNQFASISKFEDYLIKELMDAGFTHLNGTHKVKLTFIVEAYGALSDIKFKGNPDAVLVEEVKRLLLESGDWYPAESGDKAVASKVRISLKLNFD